MATSNSRDVRLGVEIQTAGEENLKRLAAEMRALAKEGGDAAPRYNELANQLERVSAEARELDVFRKVSADLGDLNAQTQLAVERAERLRIEYQQQAKATDDARAAQARLVAELDSTKRAVVEQRQQQDLLKASVLSGALTAKQAAAQNGDLAESIANLNAQARKLGLDLKTANAEVREASAAQAKLETASTRAANAAIASQTAFRQQAQALREAREAGERLGADFTSIESAQDRLNASLREAVGVLDQRSAAALEQVESDRLAALAARGLADATDRARVAAQGELAALREPEEFSRRYAEALRQTALAEEAAATAARDAALAAERKAAATREQTEANRVAAISARGLAEATDRARVAAQSELAAIRESEEFTRRYAESLRKTVLAEEAAASAARDAAIAAERKAAATLEQSEADRIAAITARGLADAQERSRAAAQSELAAIRESEQFIRRYTEAKAAAIARTNEFIKASGASVDAAFGTAGVRSIQAIEAEINDVNRAMSLLQAEFIGGRRSMADFERASASAATRIAALKREIQTIPGTTTVLEGLGNKVNDLVSRFGALSAAVATIGFAVKPVLDATIALDQMRRVLTTVSGSAEVAEQQIEFLRRTAQASGQQFTEIGASYAKFAASALQSGLSLEDTQRVFESVSLAAGNLGLSSDQAKRALEALSQIASKGTVSMEELRQQLGDALPGVLPLLAKELGLTQAELNKVVESGQLLASEAIPAIGRALDELGPKAEKVEGIVASFNRFLNSIKQVGTEVTEGPFGQAVGKTLQLISFAVLGLGDVVVRTSVNVEQFGKTIGATLAFLAGGAQDVDAFKATLAEFSDEATAKLESYRKGAFGAGEETKKFTEAVGPAGESLAKLALEQQKAIDAAELQSQVTEKLAQAVETEARSVEKNRNALLSENEAVLASLDAANRVADAREAVAKAAETEARVLRESRVELVETAKAQGKSNDEIKAGLEVLDKKILKADADVAKTRAQAGAARAAAEAASLAAEKFGDQSRSIDALRESVDKAQRVYDTLTDAYDKSLVPAEAVAKAADALAKAKNRLRDAVDDLSEALERELGLLKADVELQQAGLKLELARAKNEEDRAIRAGNEYAARQAVIRQREIEQLLERSSLDLKNQEAAAGLRALDVMERELAASGALTVEKQVEIEIRRKGYQTQLLETEATREGNKSKDEELKALKNGTAGRGEHTSSVNTNSGAMRENSGAVSGNTTELNKNATAAEKAAAAQRKYVEELRSIPGRLVDGDGFGGINSTGVQPSTSTGMSDFSMDSYRNNETRTVTGQYTPPDNSGDWYFDSAAFNKAFPTGSPSDATAKKYWKRKSLEQQRNAGSYDSAFGGYAGSSQQRAGIPETGGASAPTSAPAAPASQTVTINLGGKSATVSGSPSEVQALIDLLREAERQLGGP